MNNKSTNQNNYTFEQAILEGRSIAEVYLEVMEKSAHSRIQQLSQSPEFHQAIALKFNQVFENDTEEVVNEYANQCYQELKHLDCANEVELWKNEEENQGEVNGLVEKIDLLDDPELDQGGISKLVKGQSSEVNVGWGEFSPHNSFSIISDSSNGINFSEGKIKPKRKSWLKEIWRILFEKPKYPRKIKLKKRGFD